MKTRIARDVATARRSGRPIRAAMGTAGWAQAEANRARVRSIGHDFHANSQLRKGLEP
ncbi:MAG TPA: hypothetical protein VKD28_05275 [Gemmatimonadales bacterium]|nr:hypothetical protein [Gemmatimonadales bacterium]